MLRPFAAALAIALCPLAACTVGEVTGPGVGDPDGEGDGDGDGSGDGDGDGSGDGDGDGEPASVSIEVLPGLAEMTLGTSATFDVVVTSDNYAGSVGLSMTGVPASWQVSFES